MPRTLRLALLAAAACVLTGADCGRASSILLVVDSDLAPGVELRSLETRASLAGAVHWSRLQALSRDDAFPQSLRLLPGSRIDGAFVLDLEGRLVEGGGLLASRQLAFAKGREVVVELCLLRRCLEARDDDCFEGRCPAAGADGDADADDDGPCVPGPELCNGIDDDCDPSTPDGADEPTLGTPCDGPDRDLCEEGVVQCVDGELVCSDTTDDNLELCNGIDDDCDPSTPDGADEPALGTPCDGPDRDLCEEGVVQCVDGELVCSDETDDNLELCNGIDDDCDGTIDDGASCPCPMVHEGAHTYLLCRTARTWHDALAYCEELGYTLVEIDDEDENELVAAEASAAGITRFWIGLNDIEEEGRFVWARSGTEPGYTNWAVDEPNDYGEGEDCGEVGFPTVGLWNDNSCTRTNPFVCEAW